MRYAVETAFYLVLTISGGEMEPFTGGTYQSKESCQATGQLIVRRMERQVEKNEVEEEIDITFTCTKELPTTT